MSHVRTVGLSLICITLCRVGPAQPLDLRIVSQGCVVTIQDGSANPPTQTVPANTNVSNGYRISVQDWRANTATSTLAAARDPSSYVVTLDDVTTQWSPTPIRPEVSTALQLTLTAPRPARVRMDARWRWSSGGGFGASGSLWLGTRELTSFGGAGLEGGVTTTIDVGPTPVTLDLSDRNWLSNPVEMHWRLVFTPVSSFPCGATTYGSACGDVALAIGTDLQQPGRPFVELTAGQQPGAGVLVAGFQRLSIPIGPCFLHNEALVALPITGRLHFDPPMVPGFGFLLQGGTLVGGQLTLTAGYDLRCQ